MHILYIEYMNCIYNIGNMGIPKGKIKKIDKGVLEKCLKRLRE